MFLGRKSELKQIKNLINSNKKQALMIYGKRRVGKSALIIEALKDCNCKVIYYECLITSIAENLRNLEKRVQDIFTNKYLHFESFKELFDFLGSCKEKVVVVLDEYSYLKKLAAENYVDSMFQSIIDQMHDNLSLVLLGSYVGIMKELPNSMRLLLRRDWQLRELNLLFVYIPAFFSERMIRLFMM